MYVISKFSCKSSVRDRKSSVRALNSQYTPIQDERKGNMKLLENAMLDTLSAAISTNTGDRQIDGR